MEINDISCKEDVSIRKSSCPQEGRLSALEVRVEVSLKALERGVARFERFEDSFESIDKRLNAMQSFQDTISGGQKFFIGFVSLFGVAWAVITYFFPKS